MLDVKKNKQKNASAIVVLSQHFFNPLSVVLVMQLRFQQLMLLMPNCNLHLFDCSLIYKLHNVLPRKSYKKTSILRSQPNFMNPFLNFQNRSVCSQQGTKTEVPRQLTNILVSILYGSVFFFFLRLLNTSVLLSGLEFYTHLLSSTRPLSSSI